MNYGRITKYLIFAAAGLGAFSRLEASTSNAGNMNGPSIGPASDEELTISLIGVPEAYQLLRDRGYSKCSLSEVDRSVTLSYIGSTDHQLLACLSRLPSLVPAGGEFTLNMSSFGGDAISAALAGLYLSNFRATVVVDGPCFSSCANYVATAAKRLVVKPYSFLGLHGAPMQFTAANAKKLEDSIMADPTVSDERKSGRIRASLDAAKKASDVHLLAKQALNVGSQWYELNLIVPRAQTGAATNMIFIPSEDMTAKCLKGLEQLSFWEWSSDTDREAFRKFFPGESRFVYVNLEGQGTCN
jgi:hypothetical protein